MIIQNASELKITRLYHYQRFSPDWLRQILFDKRVYFSNPNDFNDPWDCRPYFHIPEADDRQACERCIQWLDAAVRRKAPCLDEQEHVRKMLQLRNDRPSFEQFIQELSESIGSAINDSHRVYCLSTKDDSTLMWSQRLIPLSQVRQHLGLAGEI